MGKNYTVTELSRFIGVTGETIKNWEKKGIIPKATRAGLKKGRIWDSLKAEQILSFARDNGYPVKYTITRN